MPSIQFLKHIIQRQLLLPQQHQEMIDQIAGLVTELLGTPVLGCNDNLRRLLAYLLQNLVYALLKQVRRVSSLRTLHIPFGNNGFKISQNGEPIMRRLNGCSRALC
ncbi:hypothetical protein D3C73_1395490 [compost metagenome]